MNKIKSFVEKFQMFITNLPKFEATGTESTKVIILFRLLLV